MGHALVALAIVERWLVKRGKNKSEGQFETFCQGQKSGHYQEAAISGYWTVYRQVSVHDPVVQKFSILIFCLTFLMLFHVEYEKLWAAVTGGRGAGRGKKKAVTKGVDRELLKYGKS